MGAGLRRRIPARHRPGRGAAAGHGGAAGLPAPARAPRSRRRRGPDRPQRGAARRPRRRPDAGRLAAGAAPGHGSAPRPGVPGRATSTRLRRRRRLHRPVQGAGGRAVDAGRRARAHAAATGPWSTPAPAATWRSPSPRGSPPTSPPSAPGCPAPGSSSSSTSPRCPPCCRAALPTVSGFGKLSAVEANVVEQELAELVGRVARPRRRALLRAARADGPLPRGRRRRALLRPRSWCRTSTPSARRSRRAPTCSPGVVPGTDATLPRAKATASRVQALVAGARLPRRPAAAAVTLTPACGLAGATPGLRADGDDARPRGGEVPAARSDRRSAERADLGDRHLSRGHAHHAALPDRPRDLERVTGRVRGQGGQFVGAVPRVPRRPSPAPGRSPRPPGRRGRLALHPDAGALPSELTSIALATASGRPPSRHPRCAGGGAPVARRSRSTGWRARRSWSSTRPGCEAPQLVPLAVKALPRSVDRRLTWRFAL